MDEALLKELEDLREENKILRDSLVEIRPEESSSEGEGGGLESSLRAFTDMLGSAMEQVKEDVRPGTEKLTAFLSRQMEENPAPMLISAFTAGYLLSRGFDKK